MADDRVTDAMVLAAIDGFNEAAADGELFLTSLRDKERMRFALIDALRAEAGAVASEECDDCKSMFEDALGHSLPCPKHRPSQKD